MLSLLQDNADANTNMCRWCPEISVKLLVCGHSTHFRKPSVLAFLPLGIMVCSTPLFQKSLSIPSRYTPG